MKLTPWFPPEVKPVHVGYYETGIDYRHPESEKGGKSIFLWWFDGKNWVDASRAYKCSEQNRYWRGLAEKPKGNI